MNDLPVYIDIDGTLTDKPEGKGTADESRIKIVQRMIEKGTDVVLWSAAGGEYARKFADDNGLDVVAALGKPDYCIDDMTQIKWNGLSVRKPSYLEVWDVLDSVEGARKLISG